MQLHGFLNIDKPLGWTSHDVVARLRRILGTKRIGHAGTLDPAATGVLVIGVGRATRFLDYVQSGAKSYVAHVVLGDVSDTADIDGRIQADEFTLNTESVTEVSVSSVEGALSNFVGTIQQVPPKYSALKQDGEPLYRKMRRGERVDVPARTVTVESINVLAFDAPDLVLSIDCGPGVYIRSLARDLGEHLGTGAYLHHLIRTHVSDYTLPESVHVDQLETLSFPTDWTNVAYAIDTGLQPYAALALNEQSTTAWYHGRSIGVDVPVSNSDDLIRAYTHVGTFAGTGTLAHARENESAVRPRLVLPPS